MMTAHFWMGAGATLGIAAMMGLGLGSYVTSPQGPARNVSEYAEAVMGDQTATDTSFAMQKGPGTIHCTGCGPTLAERRWQADMAGLDLDAMRSGNSDPVLRDYEAAAAERPADAMPDAPPASVHASPPQVTRFAVGDTPPPVGIVGQAAVDDPAPPPTAATMPSEPRL